MKEIFKHIQLIFKHNKHWVYFIIFCISISSLWNLRSKNFWDYTIVLSFQLYLFGAFSWALIEYFKKDK